MASALRTESRARHVVQEMEKRTLSTVAVVAKRRIARLFPEICPPKLTLPDTPPPNCKSPRAACHPAGDVSA